VKNKSEFCVEQQKKIKRWNIFNYSERIVDGLKINREIFFSISKKDIVRIYSLYIGFIFK